MIYTENLFLEIIFKKGIDSHIVVGIRVISELRKTSMEVNIC